ncbi:MAG: GNAT family N-acetyltransferase [Proteobacteria bacterium]|nr:GNAT family N-acetyltransferase [Pseudomonadota bacterium]
MEVKIRQINDQELGDVVRIQEAIMQRRVAPDWLNLVKMQISKPDGISLVAVEEDRVVGFFFGEVKHGAFGLEHSGWIEMFGVDPKDWGQGVGRALAFAAFKRFLEAGVEEIYTAVRWDSGDLLAFFKKIGFNLSNFINLKARLE